jgi:hypothetical protein
MIPGACPEAHPRAATDEQSVAARAAVGRSSADDTMQALAPDAHRRHRQGDLGGMSGCGHFASRFGQMTSADCADDMLVLLVPWCLSVRDGLAPHHGESDD